MSSAHWKIPGTWYAFESSFFFYLVWFIIRSFSLLFFFLRFGLLTARFDCFCFCLFYSLVFHHFRFLFILSIARFKLFRFCLLIARFPASSPSPSFLNRLRYTKMSVANKQAYAKLHGYDVIIASSADVDHSRPAAWSKLLVLEKHLADYDYLM